MPTCLWAVDILYCVVVMAEVTILCHTSEEPNEYTSVAVEVYEQDQMELLELERVLTSSEENCFLIHSDSYDSARQMRWGDLFNGSWLVK